MRKTLIAILFGTLAFYGCSSDGGGGGSAGSAGTGGAAGSAGTGGTAGAGGGAGMGGMGGMGGDGGMGGGAGMGGMGGDGGMGGGGGIAGEVVYQQDFNDLDIGGALIGDGWRYFINVFAAVPYGYGDPAPNGPQICALVDDQGGPEQEPQQLSVYSDYNNADHATSLIETNVFQEPFDFNNRIPASEVGNTYVFQFQAKAGNIADSSTANAFIKTLNPNAGFAVSASDTVDTTNLPDTWGGFTLSLEITADLEGHLLQYGFQTNATNFESSANFYDNVVLIKQTP